VIVQQNWQEKPVDVVDAAFRWVAGMLLITVYITGLTSADGFLVAVFQPLHVKLDTYVTSRNNT
jgi:hypothetical protein